jgi:transcriptional regulator of acetoin/glycerol metabolism
MIELRMTASALELAKAQFLVDGQGAQPLIAPHISRSWRRCFEVEVVPLNPVPLALSPLRERREQSMRLLECAQPELDGLTEHALGNGCVVVLCDAQGLILDEIGSPDFLPKAHRVALAPGVEWSEASRGTNAIGTALIERQALMVLGGEHYLAQNAALGCAAAPIFNGRGEIAGLLDISGEAIHVDSHALGLVRMAAQQIEHRMMLTEANGHLLRFHGKPSLLGTSREGLILINDGRIVAANRAALALLGQAWDGLLDQSAEALLGQRWTRLESQSGLLTLPGGQQIAAIVERSVVKGGRFRSAERSAMAPAAAPLPVGEPTASPDPTLPLLRQAVRVMNEGLAVLVTGETGSGKEVFARRLHQASRRAKSPFVAVNCAALPDTLIEAELFGYDDGAFTGARRRGMPGRIREAQGGVLFLDEIGDMALALQTRLLRVLEERVVSPLGGGQGVAVDFALICATHRDLDKMVAEGGFRSDLLYRVNGFVVGLPALRDRADRGALIEQLLAQLGGTARRLRLDAAALALLIDYRWPGNVRELVSVLRAVVALAEEGDVVGVDSLPAPIRRSGFAAQAGQGPQPKPPSAADSTAQPLAAMARSAIDRALLESAGDIGAAARALGVHRSTIYRHLAAQRKS